MDKKLHKKHFGDVDAAVVRASKHLKQQYNERYELSSIEDELEDELEDEVVDANLVAELKYFLRNK